MYNYWEQKAEIFKEENQGHFLSVRDTIFKMLASAGCCRMQEILKNSKATGDSWTMMAYVDRLVELEQIREITKDVPGQHRIFTYYKS